MKIKFGNGETFVCDLTGVRTDHVFTFKGRGKESDKHFIDANSALKWLRAEELTMDMKTFQHYKKQLPDTELEMPPTYDPSGTLESHKSKYKSILTLSGEKRKRETENLYSLSRVRGGKRSLFTAKHMETSTLEGMLSVDYNVSHAYVCTIEGNELTIYPTLSADPMYVKAASNETISIRLLQFPPKEPTHTLLSGD